MHGEGPHIQKAHQRGGTLKVKVLLVLCFKYNFFEWGLETKTGFVTSNVAKSYLDSRILKMDQVCGMRIQLKICIKLTLCYKHITTLNFKKEEMFVQSP